MYFVQEGGRKGLSKILSSYICIHICICLNKIKTTFPVHFEIVAKISIMINSTIIANGFNAEKHLFAISEMTQKHILVFPSLKLIKKWIMIH